ncbi:MAG TPA: 5-dehydro-4-deoxy-D-glucuronate isomerase [Flavisolibacter sp.]
MKQLEERYACSPSEVMGMNTTQLREHFLIQGIMKEGEVTFTYLHYDRMMVGGVVPSGGPIVLPGYEQLKSAFFLERREMGIINTGGRGVVTADGKDYALDRLDCLYLGKGIKEVTFTSDNKDQHAKYFILSAPAHQAFPATLMTSSQATPAALGAAETSNQRTIYKYIHEDGIKSCQLVMGLTVLQAGSVWNTMPAHTHNRRSEVYLYFDLDPQQRVFHFMGAPAESRHLVMAADEAVVSAPWSIHSGCGTSRYSFIWGMAGENQSFADMDMISMHQLQ